MQKRKLGRSGIEVAPLVLGGNVFGWTAKQDTSFALLDAFVDAGFNAVDTADVYSVFVPGNKGGESETVIGNWLKRTGRRSDIVIATKVGMQMAPDKTGLSRKHILQSVEDSLQRLQTDYIDMYFAHQDDPKTPLDETLSTFAELIGQGKIRTIGASNYTGTRLREALAVSARLSLPRYEYLQPHYNLYERAGYEQDLEPVCAQEQLGVVTYFALASGFLTGKYRSEADFAKSPRGRRMSTYLNPRGLRILKGLDEVAARYRATPAQLALAWLMARPNVTAPIASATSVEQLKDITAAAGLVLDDEAIRTLDAASEAD
jgi:aryl-alcohol dehydrogenase-like predicted oxidoreductase